MNNNMQPAYKLTSSNSSADLTREIVLVVVESLIFLILELVVLVGNVLICLAFYRKHSLRKVTNYLVLSLAVADLLRALLILPFLFIVSVANEWILGNIGCKLLHVSGSTLLGTSLLTVMLLAINRYLHLTRPELYYKVFRKKCCVIMVLSTWLITAVLILSNTFCSEIHFRHFSHQPTVCFVEFVPKTGGFFISFVSGCLFITVPGLVVIVSYFKICRIISAYKLSKPAGQPHQRRSVCTVEEVKTTRMLTVIGFAFYICWFPVLFAFIIANFRLIPRNALKYWNFYYLFPMSVSSAVNPIVCASMSRRFRKQFLIILKCRY